MGLAALGIVVAAAAAVYACAQSVLWSVFALVILIGSLRRYFFASRFAIDADGITARYLFGRQRFAWSPLAKLSADERGAFLALAAGARSGGGRGMHVLFGNRREEVLRALAPHVQGVSP